MLFYTDKVPGKVFYYPATLDDGFHPGHPAGSEQHIFVGSKAQWEVFETSLPWHVEDMDDADYERPRSGWINSRDPGSG